MLLFSIFADYLFFASSRTGHLDAPRRAHVALATALILCSGVLWLGLSTMLVATLALTVVITPLSMPVGLILWISMAIATTGVFLIGLRPTLLMTAIDTNEFIEISAEEQPYFFELIYDLCRRSRAPRPHKVYLCPNANAGVFIQHQWRDLFSSPKRHLLVGLGLVNMLNRDELEAVLAHEFGHLRQRSMRLYGQARLIDQNLEKLSHHLQTLDDQIEHLPITVLRQGFRYPLHRSQRGVLRLRRWLNALEAEMNQHMEFDADQTAINIAGSDALISALARADWADRCFSQTLYDLEQALEEGIRSDDLFYHQEHISERMRRMPSIQAPPRRSATHPSQQDRQQRARDANTAKRRDFRSAWSLFDHSDQLRRRITSLIYEVRWQVAIPPRDAPSVQRHLDGEHAELLLAPGDNKLFGQRFIEPGPLPAARHLAESFPLSDASLAAYLVDLTERDYQQAQRRIESVIDGGPDNGANDRQWLADWDRRRTVATFSASMRQFGSQGLNALEQRLTFHLHLQDLIRWMRSQTPMLAAALEASSHPGLSTSEKIGLFRAIDTLYRGFFRGLDKAPSPPNLHGLPPEQGLTMLALDDAIIDAPATMDEALTPEWLEAFHHQWQRALNRIAHLRRKSLGALLTEEREVQARFIDRYCDLQDNTLTC